MFRLPSDLRLLCILPALLTGLVSSARADEEGIYYSRQLTFRIPFQIDAADRRVSQVVLNVSEDKGKTYQQATTAGPGDRGFTFTARRDGWYWFAVQTMDSDRRLYPASLEGVTPGLRVLVDTVSPEVKLRPLQGLKAGQAGIEWDLRDEALDTDSIRLEYRVPGQFWQERTAQKAAYGQARWEPGVNGAIDVRLQVRDRAGNLGEATVRVTVGGGKPMDKIDDPAPGGGGPEPEEKGGAAVRKVNTTKINLNYKIDDVGPSDVSVIEIWKTRDTRSWQRYPKDADKKPPFAIEVEGEGRYGFTLIAKSGVGLGDPAPRPGDQPQVWVEVDLTKPDVRIDDPVVGRGPETGNLTITWSATDKNLTQRPVTLSYATKAEGPWIPITGATRIENSGKFVWRMAADVPFEFYVRAEAIDEAGNVGQADTTKSVKVDLSTPKARVIGIDPVRP